MSKRLMVISHQGTKYYSLCNVIVSLFRHCSHLLVKKKEMAFCVCCLAGYKLTVARDYKRVITNEYIQYLMYLQAAHQNHNCKTDLFLTHFEKRTA